MTEKLTRISELDDLMNIRRLIKRMANIAIEVKKLEPTFNWTWSFKRESKSEDRTD